MIMKALAFDSARVLWDLNPETRPNLLQTLATLVQPNLIACAPFYLLAVNSWYKHCLTVLSRVLVGQMNSASNLDLWLWSQLCFLAFAIAAARLAAKLASAFLALSC